MDLENESSNSSSGDGQGNGVRMSTSFHGGTRLNLPFYDQSTDSIAVHLVAVRDILENKIIEARALEALGRLPFHRRTTRFKARFSPLPRFVRINRGDHAHAHTDDEPIEMLAHRAERVGSHDSTTNNLFPMESTALRSVSYYVWMRALVEILRVLIAFVL
ncbi:hypothetical protein AFUA_8G01320 [Aspergillus fumigatus Af293]|uniref:Uncharacterized protein n=1 Tax=Aspergillus fumigatus (strain ATCC MYA-4609 / CBS 101355 / FGSC A1100 / Af293) TaxID=330879 RepID=Q4WB76_ASPFU|nr:hypothetical protein AFUA_8G01320 [Aspergillus fumigatus Af293]EAL85036.1 hypothetical protein AFUA_8G01320 [Aspergillus fumigatus Af293]KEY81564.1 hypothetical protein BA78_8010 [Aspergillus fumigatus]